MDTSKKIINKPRWHLEKCTQVPQEDRGVKTRNKMENGNKMSGLNSMTS